LAERGKLTEAQNDVCKGSLTPDAAPHRDAPQRIQRERSQLTECVRLKPNSITLAGSELAPNKLRTSFERASVVEFGREPAIARASSLLAS